MHTRCARFRSSVLGVRPSALIRYRVSGTRCQVAGTRHLVPGTWHPISGGMPGSRFKKPAHGVCMMQDRKGSDSGYLVPGTWYLTAMSHSPISNLNKAVERNSGVQALLRHVGRRSACAP